MSEDASSLILEHLCHIRQRVDHIDEGMTELKHRITSLGSMAARDRGDTAQAQADTYRQQAYIDKLVERIERIERRLELS
jgi:hypothetical protein